MSSRVTRSSARLATEASAPAASAPSIANETPRRSSATSKKRKAPAQADSSALQPSNETTPQSGARRSKRQKVTDSPPQPAQPAAAPRTSRRKVSAFEAAAMSNTGYESQERLEGPQLMSGRNSSKHIDENSKAPQPTKTTSKRPSSRSKKSQGKFYFNTLGLNIY